MSLNKSACGCLQHLADKMREIYNARTDNPASKRKVTMIVVSAIAGDGATLLPAEVDYESARGVSRPGVIYYDARYCPICGKKFKKGGAE